MTYRVDVAVDMQAALGEGPCWDEQQELLYWVDIQGKKIHIHNPQDNSNREIQLEQQIGAFVLRAEGGAVVALQNGLYFLDLQSEQLTLITDPEEHLPQNRFNDGKCDPAGRFWVGTMGSSGTASLYTLYPDLELQQKETNVTISNGLAWSPDRTKMYYIDTPTKQIVAYDYDISTGAISNKQVALQIPESEGHPDGMTIDVQGNLWIAHWGGYQVSCWNPITGEKLDTIPIPAPQVTSCTFAGEELDTLYITTARVGLDEEALTESPQAGGLFKVKMKVKGAPSYRFEG